MSKLTLTLNTQMRVQTLNYTFPTDREVLFGEVLTEGGGCPDTDGSDRQMPCL